MNRKRIRVVGLFSFLLACVAVFGAVFPTLFPLTVSAEEIVGYSGVLDDLKKDASFDPGNYPEKQGDYSLQVVQPAEGANGELFVYLYQPAGNAKKLTATSINLSVTVHDDIRFLNYKLELLDRSGTLCKYRVKGFAVRQENVRYYAVSSVFRPFDPDIDQSPDNGNTVSEVSYAVNKQYSFGTVNGKPYVNCVDIETVVVTDKFVGYVRYPGGFAFYAAGACDSHFVAFRTDRPIDKLYEVDVYYVRQTYSKGVNTGITTSEGFSDRSEETASLSYTDKVSYTGPGVGAAAFRWDRIESVRDFISHVEQTSVYSGAVLDVSVGNRLTDAAKAELQKQEWVLRFAETPYTYEHYSSGFMYQEFTEQQFVGEVTILRLKFETDGVTYNLGVIDNKQTGGADPVNETEVSVSLNDRGRSLFRWLWLLLLFVLFAPLLPYLFRAAVWFLSLPVKAVGALAERIARQRRERRERKLYERIVASIEREKDQKP